MADALADAAFKRILRRLAGKRGLDFTEYQSSFLRRRVQSRLQAANAADFAGYDKVLESHPEEWDRLFDALTINVAEFFRDPPVWEFLQREILPPLARRGRPLRLWSAGCASGEEPYSVAILLREILQSLASPARVRILATDVDPLAIARARRGTYGSGALARVSPLRLGAFFTKVSGTGAEDSYEINPEIRSMVQFMEHNYLDPSGIWERADVILCRNSMIYLKSEAKNRAVSNFHRTLPPGGYLILGVTELLIGASHCSQFQTLRGRPGIFQKRPS